MVNGKLDRNGRIGLASIVISIFTATAGAAIIFLSASVVEMREQLAVFREFKEKGPRFSAIDAAEAHKTMSAEIMYEINKNFPPKWLVKELDSAIKDDERLHKEQQNLQLRINKLETLVDDAIVENCR